CPSDKCYHAVLAVKAVRRRFAPCSASRLRRACDGCAAACPSKRATGNPARTSESIMGHEILYVRDARGVFIPARGEEIIAAANQHLSRRVHRGVKLSSASVVRDFLAVHLGDRDCEYFCVACLDSHHRLLRFVELFRGTIDRASVHPREVVKLTLETRA